MSKATEEQLTAINTTGKNVIVSAGAGSGKTFVLKERVSRILENNTSIDELIILTFTKNAAAEMKERIRKIISENSKLENQKDLVDSAYITTFDSFSSSLVKKYNYLLGISRNFKIIDSNIVQTEIKKQVDEIFESYYENKDEDFLDMINKYAYKNDEALKSSIIDMYKTLNNLTDKTAYLNSYIEIHFNDEFINKLMDDYTNDIFNRIASIDRLYDELIELTINENALKTNLERIENIRNSTTLSELKEALTIPFASAHKGRYDEDYKPIKNSITRVEKKIKEELIHDEKEFIDLYKSTKNSTKIIIEILKCLDSRIMKFKDDHNSYEFSDIALKAIELVKNHEDVRDEIKNKTKEIMIDEYQDTNDIQETFIKYIQNNNVYMVGDVKQSIYRFRNANPYIFKDKYDRYSSGEDGYKIDLTKNFRSRNEVINNINDLFSIIMSDEIGGANYKKEHCMAFGQTDYNDNKIKDYNYNFDLLNYEYDKGTLGNITRNEIEAFIIADDINKKLANQETVMEEINKVNVSRKAEYKDFCILVDKSTNFELLKKILEYKGIPATIYKDVSIKEDDEVYIIKNLISLIIHIKDNNFDEEFNHAFMSISRSYIYKTNDNDLFDIFKDKKFKDTSLYIKCEELSKLIDSLSNKEIIVKLIDEFDIVNKLITIGDVKDRTIKLEYFVNQATSLNEFGYDIYALSDYFNQITDGDIDIQMPGKNSDANAVKIMTIHGSKGLEFPYVYIPYLSSRFKSKDHTKYIMSNKEKYGILLPSSDTKVLDNSFIYNMNNNDELKETISEKIRLLYVAITRAREKFILINSYSKVEPVNPELIVSEDILQCASYTDIITLIKNYYSKYQIDINLENLDLTKDYNNVKSNNYKDLIPTNNDTISLIENSRQYKELENKHFSKTMKKIIDKELRATLDYGTYMHYCFEVYDFKNNNINELNVDEEIKNNIKKFLAHDEVKDISKANTYKEHEIKFTKDGSIFHGIIDLLVEYDTYFDIIDYKLSNINSPEYVEQLTGYKNYIESTYNKPCNIYLYSIKKDKFKQI